jgi:hypothetical protein
MTPEQVARRRIRIRIEAERGQQFSNERAAFGLARELVQRGYCGVTVALVGGDSSGLAGGHAVRGRRALRLVVAARTG